MLPESKIFEPAQFPDQDQHDSLDDLQDEKDDNNLSELDLQRTLSLVAHTPSKCIRQIPNGGLNAWLQVLGSFMLFFNTWGVTNAFGVFEAFYSTGYLRTDPSAISIVGAIQAFFLLGSGVIVGPLFDKGYFYQLLVVGSFLTVFGMMMTSLCTEYYQILLAQGLCVGFGSGCLFVPSVAIIPTYFTSKRIVAAGIASTGGSLGGIVYPLMFYYLQPAIGYPWAIRIIGFTMLATFGIAMAVMRVRMRTTEKKRMFDFAAFREPAFSLFAFGTGVAFMGVYIPFFYISDFAISNGSASTTIAFYLLIILNGTSTFGRVLPNYVADKIGPLNVITPCAAVTAILAWCWIATSSKGGIIAFCVFYGFFSGSMVSIPPMAIVSLTPTLDVVGARMGECTFLFGCGILVGQPVAGTILSLTGSYLGLQAFCAAAVTLGVCGLTSSRAAKVGMTIQKA